MNKRKKALLGPFFQVDFSSYVLHRTAIAQLVQGGPKNQRRQNEVLHRVEEETVRRNMTQHLKQLKSQQE